MLQVRIRDGRNAVSDYLLAADSAREVQQDASGFRKTRRATTAPVPKTRMRTLRTESGIEMAKVERRAKEKMILRSLGSAGRNFRLRHTCPAPQASGLTSRLRIADSGCHHQADIPQPSISRSARV